MYITKQDFEQLTKEVILGARKYFKLDEQDERRFKELKGQISIDRLTYCIQKLIDGELDYKTAGRRGLGRASEHTPRLGAYFRKTLSKLAQNRVDELENLIASLMVKCYFFVFLVVPNDYLFSQSIESDELYEEWLPQVYGYDLESWGEKADVLYTVVQEDYQKIAKFFEENSMKPGLFGEDKTKLILTGYATAGVVLGLAEMELSKR